MSAHHNDVHVEQEDRTFVCFVCGGRGMSEYMLHSRTREHSAFFPFLKQHKPPSGAARHADIDGAVSSCFVCYSFLLQQWDDFERTNTPCAKRIYWLKQSDNESFAGMDVVGQPEFAYESVGLPITKSCDDLDSSGSHSSSPIEPQITHPPLYKKLFNDFVMNDSSKSTNVTTNESSMYQNYPAVRHDSSRPSSHSSLSLSSHVPSRPSSHSSLSSVSPVPSRSSSHSSSSSHVTSRRSSHSSISSFSRVPSRSSSHSSSSHVPSRPSSHSLPLSSPMKVGHACYICGDVSSKAALMNLYSKPFFNFPFFPPLATLVKSPKARPMADSGKVECCEKCHKNLIRQWDTYQSANVPYSERYYHFRNESSLVEDPNKTKESPSICFTCGYEDAKSLSKQINIYNTSIGTVLNEPCFKFLQWHMPAPGAKSVSKDGQVFLCSLCYKTLLLQYAVYEMSATPHEQRVYRIFDSYAVDQSVLRNLLAARQQSSEESCLLCEKFSPSLILVETVPQNAKAFFPFLKDLDRTYSRIDAQGRVPVCSSCFNSLSSQWETLKASQLPHSQKNYSISNEKCLPSTPDPISSKNNSPELYNRVSSSDDRVRTDHQIPREPHLATLPNQHAAKDSNNSRDASKLAVTMNPLPVATTCFICTEYSPPGYTYYISAFPVNGNEHWQTCTPFFPFLATHSPSSSAERLAEDGKVMVCTFCYDSLQAQWVSYETSPRAEDGNRWLRKYNLESCKYGISFVEM